VFQLALLASFFFVGILLLFLPRMSRRNIFFAVPVPEGFQATDEARRSLHSYWWTVGSAMAVGVALMTLAPEPVRLASASFYPVVLIAASAVSFFRQYRALRHLAVQTQGAPVAQQAGIPSWSLLLIGPFLFMLAAAMYLQLHWNQIPDRFPIHWGADGQPNGFSTRSWKGVFGPLAFGAGLCAWFTVMALAGWFGARSTRSRRTMLGVMVAVQYMIGALFSLVALMPLLHPPIWTIVLLPLAFLVPVLLVFAREWSAPDSVPDTTPNECWRAGMFYYNPADTAVFVEKRFGMGYTMNFANPWSWVLMAGLLLTLLAAPLVLG
jgi:uncharacterized membrane protein